MYSRQRYTIPGNSFPLALPAPDRPTILNVSLKRPGRSPKEQILLTQAASSIRALVPHKCIIRVRLKEEFEFKFFVPLDCLPALTRIPKDRTKTLESWYFAPALHRFLRGLLETAAGRSFGNFRVSAARIRRMHKGGTERYFLELKGPRKKASLPKKTRAFGLCRVRRKELSCELDDAGLIGKLIKLARAGHLSKSRYLIPGWVQQHMRGRSRWSRVQAQVDRITAAGRRRSSVALPFALVDVETRKPGTIPALMRGEFSFKWLRPGAAINLSELPSPLQRLFSCRRLATRGFDRRARRAAAVFLHELTLEE
jgi:hypothetical protein